MRLWWASDTRCSAVDFSIVYVHVGDNNNDYEIYTLQDSDEQQLWLEPLTRGLHAFEINGCTSGGNCITKIFEYQVTCGSLSNIVSPISYDAIEVVTFRNDGPYNIPDLTSFFEFEWENDCMDWSYVKFKDSNGNNLVSTSRVEFFEAEGGYEVNLLSDLANNNNEDIQLEYVFTIWACSEVDRPWYDESCHGKQVEFTIEICGYETV